MIQITDFDIKAFAERESYTIARLDLSGISAETWTTRIAISACGGYG
jgi:hypothetical protein